MCDTFPESEQCSLYAYAYANTSGTPQIKINFGFLSPPLPNDVFLHQTYDCNTFLESAQCSLYTYVYANKSGTPQKKIFFGFLSPT